MIWNGLLVKGKGWHNPTRRWLKARNAHADSLDKGSFWWERDRTPSGKIWNRSCRLTIEEASGHNWTLTSELLKKGEGRCFEPNWRRDRIDTEKSRYSPRNIKYEWSNGQIAQTLFSLSCSTRWASIDHPAGANTSTEYLWSTNSSSNSPQSLSQY